MNKVWIYILSLKKKKNNVLIFTLIYDFLCVCSEWFDC